MFRTVFHSVVKFKIYVYTRYNRIKLLIKFIDHIWLALAENDEKGAVIEIDPETKTIISTIGKSTQFYL